MKQAGPGFDFPHSVTVRDPCPPTGQLEFGVHRVEPGPEFVLPESDSPTVVIPTGKCDGDASATELGQSGECGETQAGDHMVVLEPEFEQIPVYQQVIAQIRNCRQESMK